MSQIDRLYDDIRAYKRARVLATAIHVGVLSALRNFMGGASLSDLQGELGFSIEWLHAILNVLIRLDLVDENNGRYQLTNYGREAEQDTTLRSFAGYHFYCFDSWTCLPTLAKSGKGGNFHRNRLKDKDFCRAYLMSMDQIAQAQIAFLENECKRFLTRAVLDIGAGPSSLCRRLAWQNQEMKVTAIDLPEIVSTAREVFQAPQNFKWHAQDFLRCASFGSFDAVYCSHLIEYCPKADRQQWLQKMRSFLKESAFLVIVSFLRDKAEKSEELDLFEISTGLNGEQLGCVPTAEEIMSALTKTGFREIEIRPVPTGPSYSEYLITSRINSKKENEQK